MNTLMKKAPLRQEDLDSILRPLYYDVKNASAFSSAPKLYKAARLKSAKVSLDQVKSWLTHELTYTLHKQPRWNFRRAPCIVSSVDEQWQADLADMQAISRQNRGFRYILTIIDMFSKYAFAIPLKNKFGKTLVRAFQSVFAERVPQKLQTDQGTEFDNKLMRRYLKDMGVHYFTTTDKHIKCAVVERFNRTLKSKIFKYMTSRGTKSYIDILAEVVDTYNNTVHRTIKMRPADVRPGSKIDEAKVFFNTYGYGSLRELLLARQDTRPEFTPGMKVRLIKLRPQFKKGYLPSWSEGIYTVKRVIRRGNGHVYEVADDSNRIRRKKYYPQELQKAAPRDTLPYKVVKSRLRKGRRQLLVEFRSNGDALHKCWVDSKQIPVL